MTKKQGDSGSRGAVDLPPDSENLTDYDRAHLVVYFRLLDAAAAGVDWRVTVRDVLDIDPSLEPAEAQRVFDIYYARAQWMARVGYRLLASNTTN